MSRIILYMLVFFVFWSGFGQNNIPERAVVLCQASDIASRASGDGGKPLLSSTQACGHIEPGNRNYLWYRFTVVKEGTLGFTIKPSVYADYDFYIYRVSDPKEFDRQEGQGGIPTLRCSYAHPRYASPYGVTGLSAAATDVSEDDFGDSFLRLLDVKPGETYYLLINRYSYEESSFHMEWTGSIVDRGENPFVPIPETNTPSDVVLCDAKGDGEEMLNLDAVRTQMTKIQGASTITFHESLADASNQLNALSDNYVNKTNPQKLYARITSNSLDQCFDIKTFNLSLKSPPKSNADIVSLKRCSDNLDEHMLFNLSEVSSSVTDNLTENTIGYYSTLKDAQDDQNALQDSEPYRNKSNPEKLFWRLTKKSTGCSIYGDLNLEVKPLPEAFRGYKEVISLCDGLENTNDEDGIGVFDLTDIEDVVGKKLSSGEYRYTYYQNRQDALSRENPIGSPEKYSNIKSPISQSIYVEVNAKGTNQCAVIGNLLDLVVNPLPKQFLTSPILFYCTEGNNVPATLGYNFGEGYSYHWNSEETAPEIFITRGGEFWVKVTNNSTGCSYQSNSLIIRESSIPRVDISGGTLFSASQEIELRPIFKGVTLPEYSLDGLGFQDGLFFKDVLPGRHRLRVNDKNGCGFRDYDFNVVGYFKFFTPNGDGVNDLWSLEDPYNQVNRVDIFDRYGRHIRTLNSGESWDGSFNGLVMPSSDYWFKFIYTDSDETTKELRTNITLKR